MKTFFYIAIIYIPFFLSCDTKLREVIIKDENGRKMESYYVDMDSLRQGPYISYLNDGDVFEQSYYKNDVLDGERIIFHKNGKVEIEEHYINGTIDGPYKTYYNNGQLNLEAHYEQGVMKGIVKRYFDTGELMEEVTFDNNMENGPFKEYYKNGNVRWEGNYKDGNHEYGIIKEYSEDGTLIKKMDCGKYKGEYICQTIWTLEEGDKALQLSYDEE